MQQRIKELRKLLGITQNELAVRLGKSVSSVTGWERLGAVPPKELERISQMFGVNLDWLKTGKGKIFIEGKPVYKEEENDLKFRLKHLRKHLGLVQQDVADRLDVAFSSVSSWEKTGNIPKAKRLLLCKVFGVNLRWLETGEGEMFDTAAQPLATPREYALKNGCDEITATIFERFIDLPDNEKRIFSRILTQIVSGASPEPTFQVNSSGDLTTEGVEGSIILKGQVTSRDITVNNFGKIK